VLHHHHQHAAFSTISHHRRIKNIPRNKTPRQHVNELIKRTTGKNGDAITHTALFASGVIPRERVVVP